MSPEVVITAVLVALAAAAGAVVRHLVDGHLNGDFPIGTLAVNLAASFALGLVAGAGDPVPTIVGVGALGALSTWSATANEAATMARAGAGRLALGYLGLSVSSGVLLAWFGLRLGSVLI